MSISGARVLAMLGATVPVPPAAPWVMRQTWRDLLFAHWPVPAEDLARLMPAGLPPDTFDGTAWVGVVPFVMTGVRPRGFPSVPPISNFPEINVRTYATRGGEPGVYFFSLDAGNALAVGLARALFSLPYFRARFSIQREGATVRYDCRRVAGGAGFAGAYHPAGPEFQAPPGSLEHFLVERYCLYTADRRGTIYRGQIRHPPWRLRVAEAEIARETLADAAGITLLAVPPLLHCAAPQEVVAWPIQRVR